VAGFRAFVQPVSLGKVSFDELAPEWMGKSPRGVCDGRPRRLIINRQPTLPRAAPAVRPLAPRDIGSIQTGCRSLQDTQGIIPRP